MEKKFKHYFTNQNHKTEDYFVFETFINNKKYIINSCSDVFSKNTVDYGSNLLISTIIKNENLSGDCLDLCCGYGVIAIALADNFCKTNFTLCDINKNAVYLSKKNVQQNNVKNIDKIFESDGFEKLYSKFDYVVCNPPIKAGKENLYKILEGAMQHLKSNGAFYFVMKKKHGQESVKKNLAQNYNVDILKRDKTYYVMKCTKQE